MISFEFAGTPTNADSIIKAWEDAGVLEVARKSLYWDFAFIVVYASTFSLLTMLAANVYRRHDLKWLALITTGLTLGQWLAGGFDVMENCALLYILSETVKPHWAWPLLATISAGIKFGLIAVGLLFATPAAFMCGGKRRND